MHTLRTMFCRCSFFLFRELLAAHRVKFKLNFANKPGHCNIKVIYRVKVKVTAYYHTSILGCLHKTYTVNDPNCRPCPTVHVVCPVVPESNWDWYGESPLTLPFFFSLNLFPSPSSLLSPPSLPIPLSLPSPPSLPIPSLPPFFSTPSLPFPSCALPSPFPEPPPSLRSRIPLFQLGFWGSTVSSPSGVFFGAPAEIDFGAF